MSSKSWLDYLDGVETTYPEDISLFPLIDEEPDTPHFREKLLKARFRWIKEQYERDTWEMLLAMWHNRDLLLEARGANAHLDLFDFYNHSEALVLHLLRAEADNLSYYKQLRDALRLRVRLGTSVLFLGPTIGAEIEAISQAGGAPAIITHVKGIPWIRAFHERMFHDSVQAHVYTYNELVRYRPETHFVVLSNFIPEIASALRLASQYVGSYGYILFSAQNKKMVEAAENLGMIRRDVERSELATFFKHRAFTDVE